MTATRPVASDGSVARMYTRVDVRRVRAISATARRRIGPGVAIGATEERLMVLVATGLALPAASRTRARTVHEPASGTSKTIVARPFVAIGRHPVPSERHNSDSRACSGAGPGSLTVTATRNVRAAVC